MKKKLEELKQEQKELIEELINLTIEIENNQVEINKLTGKTIKELEEILNREVYRPKNKKSFWDSIRRKKKND